MLVTVQVQSPTITMKITYQKGPLAYEGSTAPLCTHKIILMPLKLCFQSFVKRELFPLHTYVPSQVKHPCTILL